MARGARLNLKNSATFTLPGRCPTRNDPDPCVVARSEFEERVAKTAGGFTRWDCDGAWMDGDSLVADQNKCYLIYTGSEAKLNAIKEWHAQAIELAGESAGFAASITGGSITNRRGQRQAVLM